MFAYYAYYQGSAGGGALGEWTERSKNNNLLSGSYDAYYGAGGKVGFSLFGEKAFLGVHLVTIKRSVVTASPFERKRTYSGLEFGLGPVSLSWIHNWDYSGSDVGFSVGLFKWGAHENPSLEIVGGSVYLIGGIGGSIDMDLGKFIYEASPGAIPEMDKTFHSFSDRKLKENIERLDQSLYKLKKLNGYNYTWIDNAPTKLKGYDIGLIAQEVEAVFPELVQVDSFTGYKTINYYKLIPVLVEAIKDQQKTIENQELLIFEYQKKIVQNGDLIEKILLKLEIK